MYRKDYLTYCKSNDIKGVLNLKKKELEKIVKKHVITFMIKTSSDSKDPIDLSNFEEWSMRELLKDKIHCNNYYYKIETLKEYISTYLNNFMYKKKKIDDLVLDPVNHSLYIPVNIVKILKPNSTSFENINKYIDISFYTKIYFFAGISFYGLFIKLNYKNNIIIKTDLSFNNSNSNSTEYFLGYLPGNINIDSDFQNDFYTSILTFQSLDCATTTEALLSRLCFLYERLKLCELKEKDSKIIYIKAIQNLPKTPLSWTSTYRNLVYVETNPPSFTKESLYYKLIEEINDLEA